MDYDPKVNIQHWPTPMARFGQNALGENLYRIVFAPSMRQLVFRVDSAGVKQTKWILKYSREAKRKTWIMEVWRSAFDYCGTSPDVFTAATGTVIDPRGEYDLCHEFETCNPGDANIDKLISWIEMGRKRRAVENQIAIRDEYEREEAATHDRLRETILEKLPAFGNAPMSAVGGSRGTKTKELRLSAKDVKLPAALRGMDPARPFQGTFGPRRKVRVPVNIPTGSLVSA